MSTIKSQDEDLTLNAHGSGNDIKFQSNGSQVGSLTAEGVFTATSFAGSGASLTGLSSFDPDGAVTINDTGADVDFRVESDDNANMLFVDGGEDRVGIGTGTPSAKLDLGNTTSNTVGGTETLRMGEHAFRLMTGGENATMCLDRDNAGGTKKIMQAWNPDSGSVAIGNTTPVAAGMLAIKPTSATQSQIKLMGGDYSYGTELMSQNGSEGGTVGNTRQWFKIDHVTLGSTRRMYTTSSQIGTDLHYWSTVNTERMRLGNEGCLSIGMTDTSVYAMRVNADVGNGGYGIAFHNTSGGSVVGSINTTGSSTSYNTSSDYRLKENVDYTWDATTRLKQLKPARFNWIADDTNTLVDGFIAHEVESIVPEAVSGTKDAMTAEVLFVEADDLPEGKSVGDVKTASAPDYQGIDQAKLVPLLVKTIQELEARITALES